MQERSEELKEFILKNSSLFWYTPKDELNNISNELLVETILNYGDMTAVKELLNLMGRDKVAKIFFDMINESERKRNNFNELTRNFFSLVFRKYV